MEIIEALLEAQTVYGETIKNVRTNDIKRQHAKADWVSAQEEVENIDHNIYRDRQKIDDAKLYCGDQLIAEAFWQRPYN